MLLAWTRHVLQVEMAAAAALYCLVREDSSFLLIVPWQTQTLFCITLADCQKRPSYFAVCCPSIPCRCRPTLMPAKTRKLHFKNLMQRESRVNIFNIWKKICHLFIYWTVKCWTNSLLTAIFVGVKVIEEGSTWSATIALTLLLPWTQRPHGERIINGLFYCGVICSPRKRTNQTIGHYSGFPIKTKTSFSPSSTQRC